MSKDQRLGINIFLSCEWCTVSVRETMKSEHSLWEAMWNQYNMWHPFQFWFEFPGHEWKIKSRLFEEAKGNILNGMYPCEAEDYEYLGGLLAFLEYGAFNAELHQMGFFK